MFSRNYSQIVEVTKASPNDSSFFTEERLKFQFLGRLPKDAQLTSLDHPRLPLYRKQFQFHRFFLLLRGQSFKFHAMHKARCLLQTHFAVTCVGRRLSPHQSIMRISCSIREIAIMTACTET